MKTLLLIGAILLSTSLRANDSVIHDIDYLVPLSDVKIIVNEAPRFAAVQPTASVEFKYASCERKDFNIDKQRAENVLFVKIIITDEGDCKGPSELRTYRYQVTSDLLDFL